MAPRTFCIDSDAGRARATRPKGWRILELKLCIFPPLCSSVSDCDDTIINVQAIKPGSFLFESADFFFA